jgi:hypothetical protein
MQPDSSGQGIMQAAPQNMQPPLAGQDQGQTQIKDPNHALQIIIQMLVAQGIPPEQAKQIAMEMIKAVAQGGMEELTSDEKIHARFGGHITRQHYLFGGIGRALGNIAGGIGKAISGVVGGIGNAVKSIASSTLGKAALAAAAFYFGGPLLAGEAAGAGAAGTAAGAGAAGAGAAGAGAAGLEAGLTAEGVGSSLLYPQTSSLIASSPYAAGASFTAPYSAGALSAAAENPSLLETIKGFANNPSLEGIKSIGSQALSGATDLASKYSPYLAAGAIGASLNNQPPKQNPGETPAEYQARVDAWKKTLNEGLNNPTLSSVTSPTTLYPNNPFYAQRRAEGGRIGYEAGGIGNIIQQATKEGFFGTPAMANGGRMGYLGGGLSGFLSGSGVAEPVSGGSTGGESGFGSVGGGLSGMLGRLISQHPEMFKKQQDVSSLTPEELQALLDQQRANVAHGGIPLGEPRTNNQGVSEIDYRKKGGFVPPIGVKEKADDIPAMLSNNEFVFTANAVRNAGHGDVNKGAKRMYHLMKHLEAGGVI